MFEEVCRVSDFEDRMIFCDTMQQAMDKKIIVRSELYPEVILISTDKLTKFSNEELKFMFEFCPFCSQQI